MPTPTPELADIFREYGPAYRQTHALPLHHHRVMQAIEACRTPLLGGVVEGATNVNTFTPGIAPAATAIAPSARARHAPSG
jgi:hypothetical protein